MAEFFGKRHDNVMADIRNIIKTLPPEISGQWFIPSKWVYAVGFGKAESICFDMTRDGFTLLVMGYTGVKA